MLRLNGLTRYLKGIYGVYSPPGVKVEPGKSFCP